MMSVNLGAVPIKFLAWDDQVASREIAVAYGSKSVEIGYMHPSARSRAINVPIGSEGLRIEALDRPKVDGVFVSVPIAIPEGFKNPLVVLFPSKNSASGLGLFIIEDDLDALGWGQISLINATSKPLVFLHDDTPVGLRPGRTPTLVSPSSDAGYMEVKIFSIENKDKALYSAVWNYNDGVRKLVFIMPSKDASKGAVEFKFILEKRAVVEAAQGLR
ncbi:MAG: hypothetical protein ACSHX8_07450 [Opitutaceae bacterium]